MTNFERQESGCPCRLCSDDGDHCALGECKNVTGFAMCEVDWESCKEFKEILIAEKRLRELANKKDTTPEDPAAALARFKNEIEAEQKELDDAVSWYSWEKPQLRVIDCMDAVRDMSPEMVKEYAETYRAWLNSQ